MANLTSKFGVLLPEWREKIVTDKKSPKRDIMITKLKEQFGILCSTKQIASLRAGYPVEARIINALATLLGEGLTGESIAYPHDEEPEYERGRDGWNATFSEMVAEVFGRLRRPSEAIFARDVSELNQIADIICLRVGRSQGGEINRRVPPAKALQIAEQTMRQSREEMSVWLRSLWETDDRIPTFACVDRDTRVGVSVVVPLTESAAAAYKSGTLDIRLIGKEHIEIGSKYLFLAAVGENTDLDQRAIGRYSMAHMRAMFYQAGVLGADQSLPGNSIELLAFAGHEIAQKRLERKGFHATGTALLGSGQPIMVLLPPTRGVRLRFEYRTMQNYMRSYRELEAGDPLEV